MCVGRNWSEFWLLGDTKNGCNNAVQFDVVVVEITYTDVKCIPEHLGNLAIVNNDGDDLGLPLNAFDDPSVQLFSHPRLAGANLRENDNHRFCVFKAFFKNLIDYAVSGTNLPLINPGIYSTSTQTLCKM